MATAPVSTGNRASSPELEPIYAAHGACLIFHRSYFEAGGTLAYGSQRPELYTYLPHSSRAIADEFFSRHRLR
jgi:hypothetical protein